MQAERMLELIDLAKKKAQQIVGSMPKPVQTVASATAQTMAQTTNPAITPLVAGAQTAQKYLDWRTSPSVMAQDRQNHAQIQTSYDWNKRNNAYIPTMIPALQQVNKQFPQIPEAISTAVQRTVDYSPPGLMASATTKLGQPLRQRLGISESPSAGNILGGVARGVVTMPDEVFTANEKITNAQFGGKYEDLTPQEKKVTENMNIGLVAGMATPLNKVKTPANASIGKLQAQVEDPLKQAFVQAQNKGDVNAMEQVVKKMELDPAYEAVSGVHRTVLERLKKATSQVIPNDANMIVHSGKSAVDVVKKRGVIGSKNGIFGDGVYFADNNSSSLDAFGEGQKNTTYSIDKSKLNLKEFATNSDQDAFIKSQGLEPKIGNLVKALRKDGAYDGAIIPNPDPEIGNTYVVSNLEKLNNVIRGVDQTPINTSATQKSFEDWANTQGEPLYHGSSYATDIEKGGFNLNKNQFTSSNGKPSQYGTGVYLSPSKQIASEYGSVVESRISPDLKLYKANASDLLEKDPTKVTAELRKSGYDGIELGKDQGKIVVVFDENNVKTRSQLKSEWDKLQTTSPTLPGTTAPNMGTADLPINKSGDISNIDGDFSTNFYNNEADKWIRGVDYEGKQNAYDYATRDFPELGQKLRQEYFGDNLPPVVNAYRVGDVRDGVVSFFPNETSAQSYANRMGVDEVEKISVRTDNLLPSTSGSGEFWASADDIVDEVAKPTLPGTTTPNLKQLEQPKLPEELQLPPSVKPKIASKTVVGSDPVINLKRDVPIKDVFGNKAVLPGGEAYTPHLTSDGKIILKDGEQFLVNKNTYQNVKGQSVKAEAKPFAPELDTVEETVHKDTSTTNKASELAEKARIAKMEIDDINSSFDNPPYISGSPLRWMYRNKDGVVVDVPNAIAKQLDKLKVPINEHEDFISMAGDDYFGQDISTKFGQYTLPGGKNYREVLIKAPTQLEGASRATISDKIAKEKYGKTMRELWNSGEMDKWDEISKINETPYAKNYQSSHWDEPNVLAHIRINDRVTPDGKKVAFLEELQSDWAREARKIDDPNTTFRADPAGYPIKPPTHPLLKNWQQLSLKRALKDAVDGDAEYFAWTNGAQQKERYNLSKQLENIEWQPQGKLKLIKINPKGSPGMQVLIDGTGTIIPGGADKNNWVGKKLDEVIGKGLAEKIIGVPDGNLAEDGLNFGGEWANTLYDKQVKNIVEDLTGGKVETLDLGLNVGKTHEFKYVDGATKVENVKVGDKVFLNTEGATPDLIVTQDLGNGKFRAVSLNSWNEAGAPDLSTDQGKRLANLMLTDGGVLEREAHVFNLNDKTLPQQAIRLTPEIKAKIKGEAPQLKQPSNKQPDLIKAFSNAK
jgi:hypothetical protein